MRRWWIEAVVHSLPAAIRREQYLGWLQDGSGALLLVTTGAGKSTTIEILEGFRMRRLDGSQYWASLP
jgi:hypothetical protein